MGYGSTAVNHFVGRPSIAADLCNGAVFGGRQILKAADLKPWKSETEFVITDKEKKKQQVHRFRDAIFRWSGGPLVALLAVENQSYVNYQMPLRNMLYDALSYAEQAEMLWDKELLQDAKTTERLYNKVRPSISKVEWLSKYRKTSKLIPVITFVFYYNAEAWDGSLDLYSMLDFGEDSETAELFKKYTCNYNINLIDANQMDEENFQTEMRYLIGVIKRRGDKRELEKYIKEHEEFRHLEESTYDAMGAVLGKEELFAEKKEKNQEGRVNMCPAVQGFYDEGRMAGIEEGRRYGALENLKMIARKNFQKGVSVDTIAELLDESKECVLQWISEDVCQ